MTSQSGINSISALHLEYLVWYRSWPRIRLLNFWKIAVSHLCGTTVWQTAGVHCGVGLGEICNFLCWIPTMKGLVWLKKWVLLANGQARRKVLLHIFTVVSARLNKALEVKKGHGKVPEPGVRQASPSTKSMEHHCFWDCARTNFTWFWIVSHKLPLV